MYREKGSCHKGDRSSNMGEEYLVYPDRIKQFIAFLMNLILIVVCCGFIYMKAVPVWMKFFLGIMIIFMAVMEGKAIRQMGKRKVLYRLDQKGITDYTNPDEIVFLKWTEVGKIETVVNNTSLQIGIMGIKVSENKERMGEILKRNLSVNGNMAFYQIVIDGFQFRKKTFHEIIDQCRYYAIKYHPSVVITESKDPFLKR